MQDKVLDRVIERDIDTLLVEELHCNPTFAAWFADQVYGVDAGFRFQKAYNSAVTSKGESDVIAIFEGGYQVEAVLIENKIKAAFQPDQAARYGQRGFDGKKDGKWTGFMTCLLAPQAYLLTIPNDQIFDGHLSYEDVAGQLESQGAPRLLWKARVLRQAIAGRQASTASTATDEDVTAFMKGYINFGRQHHPSIGYTTMDTFYEGYFRWISFPGMKLARQCRVEHYGHNGEVKLSIPDADENEVRNLIGDLLPPDWTIRGNEMRVIVERKTAAIDPRKPWQDQVNAITWALSVAEEIAAFARTHSDILAQIPIHHATQERRMLVKTRGRPSSVS